MHLLALPNELLAQLLALVPHAEDLARCSCVSSAFRLLTLMALKNRAGERAGSDEIGIQALLWEERRQQFGRHSCVLILCYTMPF